MLASALVMLISLVGSLVIKRRRVYIRLRPNAAGGTDVEMGGLARTDRAGWSEEFHELHRALLELPDPDEVEEDELYPDDQRPGPIQQKLDWVVSLSKVISTYPARVKARSIHADRSESV